MSPAGGHGRAAQRICESIRALCPTADGCRASQTWPHRQASVTPPRQSHSHTAAAVDQASTQRSAAPSGPVRIVPIAHGSISAPLPIPPAPAGPFPAPLAASCPVPAPTHRRRLRRRRRAPVDGRRACAGAGKRVKTTAAGGKEGERAPGPVPRLTNMS
jgi:hypothetical protein